MSKKKHQRDPNNRDESSESGDENQNCADCVHINKSVDIHMLNSTILDVGLLHECKKCEAVSQEDSQIDDLGFELDQSLWMCLKCGNQACGRMKNQHALQHFNSADSDSHAMCVNTTNWNVWCYICDDDVDVSCKKKLLDSVEFLKKRRERQALTNPYVEQKPFYDSRPQTSKTKLLRPRGLANLGNTCFFNSVMQCLGLTPYLSELLRETQTGQYFRLPGGEVKIKTVEHKLPPLEGETERWGPIMKALDDTLDELRSGKAQVFVPKNLLGRLRFRMPQFGMGEQHDAHELLRHLLEAVREEDQKRFKSVILDQLGFSKKTDPSTVDEEKKQIVKFYGQQVSQMLLATEQVFRGVLVSTLECQVCHHVSHREENFLDLSLPISEKQVAPVLRRKADEIDDNKPSKHQIKKEKRAERKKSKKQKQHRNNNLIININNTNTPDVSMEKSDEESDADVEDNTEDSCNNAIALPAPGEDFISKAPESGYNSDKIEHGSPDSNNHRMNSPTSTNLGDSGVPSPVNNGKDEVPCVSPNSPENSPASSETNVDMGSPLLGNNSPDEEYGENNSSFQQRPISRLEFVENNKNIDLKADLGKLSLLNDGDSAKVNSCDNDCNQSMEGACALEPTEMMDQDDDSENSKEYSGTLAPRYLCEEGECSVESCLNQFTECELLIGTNKITCDMCTKRSTEVPKKPVYREASKQLLIYNPPAVLILHLKRFQVYRFRSAKVSKFVKFSTELNLGPYCSKRAQALPTFESDQTEVLYSLYGVVEHSGSIHGGHYVAYVKVRPQPRPNSFRWNFLPKNQQEKLNKVVEDAEDNADSGFKWYYISDAYVSEVSESKVLNAQAYLLFYERLS